MALDEKEMLNVNRDGWNKVADQFFEGSFDVLNYGEWIYRASRLRPRGKWFLPCQFRYIS